METINTVMLQSPYASAFKHMHAVEQEEEERAAELDQEPQIVRLFFKHGPECRRRYNEPTHNEVAAVFVGEDGAPPVNRDIVVYPADRQPERTSYMSSHADPMCYPILFPRSDIGWHNGMQHVEE